MTHEQALEVKQVLLQIGGSIPANLVDPIFNYYRTYVDASMGKPCTCQPKYWNQMLIGLREKVEETLNKVTLNEQNIEVDGGHQEKPNARGRKRKTE
jgi:hypothetical protein